MSLAPLLVAVVLVEPTALRLPAGFTSEPAALPPLVTFPMFAAFDDRGRLFVAESSGLDLYAELKALTRKCRVRRLEDRDGDGRFEQATVFAEQLVFPMGLAWRDGRLYVADPPQLVALEDTDGDGRADRRAVILETFGHTTNGSLHGLIFGPDDRLYLTMGSADGYELRRADGTILRGNTGALIRCRPDGSDAEVLCRGFENLVEVDFLAGGEIVGTDNWFQLPLGGVRDALVHLVDGGLYPRHADTPDGTRYPVTGVALPPLSRFPAVALSGLTRVRGSALPLEMRGALLTAQHNSRAVGWHTLERAGSTYRSRDAVLVASDDPDFHPSDILEDADGSLLVVDTGGWYVQHCPTGRIRDSQAPGGIHRVRWSGAQPVRDPWGLELHADSYGARELADPRPAVRERARRELASRGDAAVPVAAGALLGGSSADAAEAALWTLHAVGSAAARGALRAALGAGEPGVRAQAARALGSLRDTASAAALRTALAAGEPAVALAAAEALARCGSPADVPALLEALPSAGDAHLEHAIVHALHRLAGVAELSAALEHPSPSVQRAALVLLDQPPRPGVPRVAVLSRLSSTHGALRATALEILLAHPDWIETARELLRRWLAAPELQEEARVALAPLLAALRRDREAMALVGATIESEKAPLSLRRALIEAGTGIGPAHVPGPLESALVTLLRRTAAGPLPLRLAAARAHLLLRSGAAGPEMARIAAASDEPDELRIEALAGLVRARPQLGAAAWELLERRLRLDSDPLARLRAAEIARAAALDPGQAERWETLQRGDPLLAPSEPPGADGADGAATRIKRLAALAPLLEGGDPGRGRAVFLGSRVACGTCHAVGAEGGRIGPDLTRVGAIRSGRDLLESIVFPSSTLAQGYEPYEVVTTDGRVTAGVIARQDDACVVLRGASGAELAVQRGEIAELRRAGRSLMPEGLERTLDDGELRDLLAYLQSLR